MYGPRGVLAGFRKPPYSWKFLQKYIVCFDKILSLETSICYFGNPPGHLGNRTQSGVWIRHYNDTYLIMFTVLTRLYIVFYAHTATYNAHASIYVVFKMSIFAETIDNNDTIFCKDRRTSNKEWTHTLYYMSTHEITRPKRFQRSYREDYYCYSMAQIHQEVLKIPAFEDMQGFALILTLYI